MATRQTPWGSRPSDWELAPWSAFAARSGRPVVVEPDANLKQVTVRVRHQGVTERRLNKNRPRRIGTPNQVQVSAGHFVMSKIDARNGACGFIPEHLDGAIVTHDFPVYDIHAADPRYLDHLVDLPVFWRLCESVSDGTTNRVRLDLEQFDELRFPMPPLAEQRGIAAVLDAIDDAIERSEAVIAATEELRRSLLHELLSRGVPGRHSEWRAVRGLGVVPTCWEVVRLGEVCAEPIRNGFSTGAPDAPTGWWLLTLAAVSHGGFVPEATKPAPIDAHVQSFQLIPGDLLVSRSNTSERVGLAGIYRGTPENCSYPDLLMRVRVDNTRALVEFVEAAILSRRGRTYFERRARGTSGSMVKITGEILRQFPLALPPLEEQQAIVAALNAVESAITQGRSETDVLRSVKASASEALLSGRVRISEHLRARTVARRDDMANRKREPQDPDRDGRNEERLVGRDRRGRYDDRPRPLAPKPPRKRTTKR